MCVLRSLRLQRGKWIGAGASMESGRLVGIINSGSTKPSASPKACQRASAILNLSSTTSELCDLGESPRLAVCTSFHICKMGKNWFPSLTNFVPFVE